MEKLKYIENKDFEKLTKKQKLEVEQQHISKEIEISKLVIIPTNKKCDGYKTGHFFALTENGWFKPYIYDCWQIVTEIDNPTQIRYMILKGDFENDGFSIFTFIDEYHKAYLSSNGEIKIKKN